MYIVEDKTVCKKLFKMIYDYNQIFKNIIKIDDELVYVIDHGVSYLSKSHQFPSTVIMEMNKEKYNELLKLNKLTKTNDILKEVYSIIFNNKIVVSALELYNNYKEFKDPCKIEISDDIFRVYLEDDKQLEFINNNEIDLFELKEYEKEENLMANIKFDSQTIKNINDEIHDFITFDLDNNVATCDPNIVYGEDNSYLNIIINKKYIHKIKMSKGEPACNINSLIYSTSIDESIFLVILEIEDQNYKYKNYYLITDY